MTPTVVAPTVRMVDEWRWMSTPKALPLGLSTSTKSSTSRPAALSGGGGTKRGAVLMALSSSGEHAPNGTPAALLTLVGREISFACSALTTHRWVETTSRTTAVALWLEHQPPLMLSSVWSIAAVRSCSSLKRRSAATPPVAVAGRAGGGMLGGGRRESDTCSTLAVMSTPARLPPALPLPSLSWNAWTTCRTESEVVGRASERRGLAAAESWRGAGVCGRRAVRSIAASESVG